MLIVHISESTISQGLAKLPFSFLSWHCTGCGCVDQWVHMCACVCTHDKHEFGSQR